MTTKKTNCKASELAEHIRQLAAAFGVGILEMDMPPEFAGAVTAPQQLFPNVAFYDRPKAVTIAPVVDETTYAVALHELGHLVHPLGRVAMTEASPLYRKTRQYDTLRDCRLVLLEEASAWEWAQQMSMTEWTPPMDRVRQWATEGYTKAMRRFGV